VSSTQQLTSYLDDAASEAGWLAGAGSGGSWKISGSDWVGRGGASDTGPTAASLGAPPLCWPSTALPITWYLSSLDMSFLDERPELATALSV